MSFKKITVTAPKIAIVIGMLFLALIIGYSYGTQSSVRNTGESTSKSVLSTQNQNNTFINTPSNTAVEEFTNIVPTVSNENITNSSVQDSLAAPTTKVIQDITKKVGGNFKVVNIEKVGTNRPLSEANVDIHLEGTGTVSGTYDVFASEGPLQGQICLKVDKNSSQKMPTFQGEARTYFCARNTEMIRTHFKSVTKTGNATFTFKDYEIVSLESEVTDLATITDVSVKVSTTTDTTNVKKSTFPVKKKVTLKDIELTFPDNKNLWLPSLSYDYEQPTGTYGNCSNYAYPHKFSHTNSDTLTVNICSGNESDIDDTNYTITSKVGTKVDAIYSVTTQKDWKSYTMKFYYNGSIYTISAGQYIGMADRISIFDDFEQILKTVTIIK